MTRFSEILRAHSVASLVCAFALIGATFAGVQLAKAPTALADYTDCPSATFCLWVDANYSNTRYDYTNNNTGTDHWHLLSSGIINRASSLVDMRQNVVYINGGNGDDDCIGVGTGYRRGNLSNYCWPNVNCQLGSENDSIEYIDLIYSGTSC